MRTEDDMAADENPLNLEQRRLACKAAMDREFEAERRRARGRLPDEPGSPVEEHIAQIRRRRPIGGAR